MAEPILLLKEPKGTKATPILIRWFISKRQRFTYSTRQKVKPSLWSSTKRKVLPRHKSAEKINAVIESYLLAASKAYAELLEEAKASNRPPVVTNAMLRTRIDILTGKTKNPNNLFSFIDEYIKELDENPSYHKQTVKGYVQMFDKLKEFAATKRQKEFDFADMNQLFFDELVVHLQKKGLTNSYINKIIQRLKAVLNKAYKRGNNPFDHFKGIELDLKIRESNEVYLTKDELQKLWELDLSNRPRFERVRDMFLLGAYTGLRFSDYSRLNLAKHFSTENGIRLYTIVAQKTAKKVVAPVHPLVEAILNKYDGSAPQLSETEVNRVLKMICRDAGFLDDVVIFSRHEGGKLVTREIPKYDLIKTHTGRRSWATNAYLDGHDLTAIMLVTGHTQEKDLRRYIRVTKLENALAMAEKDNEVAISSDTVSSAVRIIKENAQAWGLTAYELEAMQSILKKARRANKATTMRVV
jgi:integrase